MRKFPLHGKVLRSQAATDDDDLLLGTRWRDVIAGGAGNDRIYGFGGQDDLDGDAGDDLLYGGAQGDGMSGGDGADFLNGGRGADRMVGDAGGDVLLGGSATDALHGDDGDDILFGGDGDDRFSGGAGADFMDGGPGRDDALDCKLSPAGVSINLAAGTASGGDASGDVFLNMESVWGAYHFDNYLVGDDRNNELKGADGNDTLVGLGGNDLLVGDYGDDIILGGDGDDLLIGQNSTMTGGAGADEFGIYKRHGTTTSIITDYEDGVDIILIDPYGYYVEFDFDDLVITQDAAGVWVTFDENVTEDPEDFSPGPYSQFLIAGASLSQIDQNDFIF